MQSGVFKRSAKGVLKKNSCALCASEVSTPFLIRPCRFDTILPSKLASKEAVSVIHVTMSRESGDPSRVYGQLGQESTAPLPEQNSGLKLFTICIDLIIIQAKNQ